MASPVTAANLLDGVGEFLKLPDHAQRSLFPKEDRDKGIPLAMAPYNVAAWEQAVNDVRDIHDFDLTVTLSATVETIIKAAVCNLIVALMYDQNSKHPKDPAALKAKKYFKRYRGIIGRTQTFSPSGRKTNIGQSRRMVRA